METLTFISTASHGYLKVNKDFYNQYKDKFDVSECSYQNLTSVFLEEDYDAINFLKVLKDNNVSYNIIDVDRDDLRNVYRL